MNEKQQPGYNLPVELLDDFQIRWNAYKAVQEYMEFVNARPELAAAYAQTPEIGQALELTGRLLGEDLSRSLAAIFTAMGEAYQRVNHLPKS